MKFALASDLHLEFEGFNKLPRHYKEDPEVKLLVLAGDIVEAVELKYGSVRSRNIKDYLLDLNNNFEHVLYVMGNHEHYNNSFVHTAQNLKDRFKEIGLTNFHLLERNTFEFQGAIFFGATMWTSLKNSDPLVMAQAATYMNDYKCIHIGKGSMGYGEVLKLTPEDTASLCKRTLIQLKDFAGIKTDKKKVVITHHAPCELSLDSMYKGHFMNDAYYEDLSSFLMDSDIKVHCHGHVHTQSDYMMGNVNVVANPRGYYGYEASADMFDFKIITV